MNVNPCGVGDAATDVERVASAARGRSHTLNVYTRGIGITPKTTLDKPRTGTSVISQGREPLEESPFRH